MTTVLTPIDQVPAFSRTEAAVLATQENERLAALLASLDPDDWTTQTDCAEWDVRALASHVLGAMEGHVSFPQFVHQLRLGKKAAGDRPDVDGMTEVQVRERVDLGPGEIVKRMTVLAAPAARARKRRSSVLGRVPMKVEVDKVMERWTLGYLFDVILTRDAWMHRVDVSRATGRPLELTPDHDGRIVADVAAEWARRHGRPFRLHLTGPAGGTYTRGDGGEEITVDAVEFCRILSGRGSGTGLLAQPVPF
jgi:uncharacterized protein (TIGR03083 family)